MSDPHVHSTDPVPRPTPSGRHLPSSASGRPGEVNVIFRGLFLFVYRPNMIEALIPNMGMDHVTKAGAFLGEQSMAPGAVGAPYSLGGVAAGNAGADRSSNIVLDGFEYDPDLSMEALFTRIVLPRPKEILSFRPLTNAIVMEMDPLGLFHGKKTTGIRVFRYDSADLLSVRLLPHPVMPEPHTVPNVPGEFLNLHIVAEPERDLQSPHVRSGFDRTIALIPALRGTLKLGEQSTKFAEATGVDGKKGFVANELKTLAEINAMLLTKGIESRSGSLGSPLGEPPQSCLPLDLEP